MVNILQVSDGVPFETKTEVTERKIHNSMYNAKARVELTDPHLQATVLSLELQCQLPASRAGPAKPLESWCSVKQGSS